VLPGKYPASNTASATELAEKAVPEIFRYNPGRQGVIFPPKHPYYPQHCNGAKLNVSGLIGFGKVLLSAEEDRCQAKAIITAMAKGGSRDADYRQSIFDKPLNEQYKTVFESKNKKKVEVHQLANETKEKYKEIIYAAKAMANKGTSVKIQPEINVEDTAARIKIMPGYTHPSANAELHTEHGVYIDVKTPKVWKNINGLAVHAAKKQYAEALISDLTIKIDADKIEGIARRIFLDKNYTKDAVHFVVKGKYYIIRRG
jgi:hypothetical protein